MPLQLLYCCRRADVPAPVCILKCALKVALSAGYFYPHPQGPRQVTELAWYFATLCSRGILRPRSFPVYANRRNQRPCLSPINFCPLVYSHIQHRTAALPRYRLTVLHYVFSTVMLYYRNTVSYNTTVATTQACQRENRLVREPNEYSGNAVLPHYRNVRQCYRITA